MKPCNLDVAASDYCLNLPHDSGSLCRLGHLGLHPLDLPILGRNQPLYRSHIPCACQPHHAGRMRIAIRTDLRTLLLYICIERRRLLIPPPCIACFLFFLLHRRPPGHLAVFADHKPHAHQFLIPKQCVNACRLLVLVHMVQNILHMPAQILIRTHLLQ